MRCSHASFECICWAPHELVAVGKPDRTKGTLQKINERVSFIKRVSAAVPTMERARLVRDTWNRFATDRRVVGIKHSRHKLVPKATRCLYLLQGMMGITISFNNECVRFAKVKTIVFSIGHR